LPDISELNGTAIDNVAEFDGVAVPAAVSAPAAAYSVRLLGSGVGISSYTGPAMRVRRDTAGGTGDDDEADIAFDSGVISLDSAISNASAGVTATTLGEFINVGTVGGTTYTNPDSLSGTASCFVDEWKDQSGNANHASQATFGDQPQIHSGLVDTDLITDNGEPALDGDGSSIMLSLTDLNLTGNFGIAYTGQLNLGDSPYGTDGNNFSLYGLTATVLRNRLGGSNVNFTDSGLTYQSQLLYFYNRSGTSVTFRRDGSQIATSAYSGAVSITNVFASPPYFLEGKMQEFIAWPNTQDSAFTAIETDINGFFGIY